MRSSDESVVAIYRTRDLSNATRRVLLVDDDTKLLRALERDLQSDSLNVLTAVNGVEANSVLSNQRVDLIVSDNLMPGMLGMKFLAGVRERFPDVKLVLLSGYMPDNVADRAMTELGVSRVLCKPISSSKLAAVIRELLAESRA
jgi:DNA-binding NtrC family response regulator